jgi:hypothetical protein
MALRHKMLNDKNGLNDDGGTAMALNPWKNASRRLMSNLSGKKRIAMSWKIE